MPIRRLEVSESYDNVPRVSSSHDRWVYDALNEISTLIDFNHPIFHSKALRSRSLASAQTVIVEIALQNEEVLETLRKYMILGGKDWYPILHYQRRY